jgi:hypothetical protein
VALVDVEVAVQGADDRQARERSGELLCCPLGDAMRGAEQEGAVAVRCRLPEQVLTDVVVGQPGRDGNAEQAASPHHAPAVGQHDVEGVHPGA